MNHLEKEVREWFTQQAPQAPTQPGFAGRAATRQPGLTVILACRERRLGPDTWVQIQTQSILKHLAQLEAEREARRLGWPIIGHVVAFSQPPAEETATPTKRNSHV